LGYAGAVLDRPTFDRDNNVILIPYRGPAPPFETESKDGGTRLITYFTGSQSTLATPYKLGLFHPLVSKVEMTPMQDEARVRLSIALSSPGRLSIVPDIRASVLRIQVGSYDPLVAQAMQPQPMPMNRQVFPGQLPLSFQPPAFTPAVSPSVPPVKWGGTSPLPGTPASGEYVYRKAIPAENGRDVTELQIRTPRRSAIDIQTNIQNDAVNVAVTPPDGQMAPAVSNAVPEGWTRPLPNEPYKLPGYRGEPVFRPVAALDAIVGYTLMSETASALGTRFSGAGSSLLGLTSHLPIDPNWNVNLSGETFGYLISSVQVPAAETRRDEYFGTASLEYLPIRKPWVLATGVGYWGRYVTQRNNILAPPDPSLLFSPTQLWHGPSLTTRVWAPIWNGLGFTADLAGAPYMFGGSDSTVATIGNVYGFQGMAGLKYGQRYFSIAAGYRQQAFGSFNGAYAYSRGGPEVQLVWRF
jgi:hypothetical protein